MKQRIFVFLFSLIVCLGLFFTRSQPVLGYDARVIKLNQYLVKQNSLLANYAADFVDAADRNGIDYRLLVAISGVESTFGKNYIVGTYNVYGWGSGQIPFSSWYDSISEVSYGLKNHYINMGAETVEQIGRIYCPPNSAHWAASVNYFIGEIEATDIQSYVIPTNLSASALIPLSI